MRYSLRCSLFALTFCSLVRPEFVSAAFVLQSVGGDATTLSIQSTVDLFRADLGDPNNGNTAGPLASGRREINWDGGGSLTTLSPTPFTGFQNIRGASFTTPGTGFVQAPTSGFDTTFSNATYSATFGVFSPQRLFSPIDSNIMDVFFVIPGTSGAVTATVRGFGAVFTDVDVANSTRVQFFDTADNEIFNQFVPQGTVASQSLSFLGASGNAGEQIFRVRITSGNAALGPNDNPGGGTDVAAIDDLIYGEPVPEPTTAVFLVLAAGACVCRRWREQ
jgi:hypothetical protein